MRRTLFTSLALLGAASAATFAGFTIKPYGDQKLNLQTGTTVLASGGVATDAKQGLTIDAKYIEYKEGDTLSARNAKLTTSDGGVLNGDAVQYNAKNGVLTASGNLVYNDARVKGLTAPGISLDTRAKLAVATGGVKSASPAMSAATAVVDYANKRAVMYGNYEYVNEGTRLRGTRPTSVLLVTWDAQNKFVANTKPTAAQLQPYQSYLK